MLLDLDLCEHNKWGTIIFQLQKEKESCFSTMSMSYALHNLV